VLACLALVVYLGSGIPGSAVKPTTAERSSIEGEGERTTEGRSSPDEFPLATGESGEPPPDTLGADIHVTNLSGVAIRDASLGIDRDAEELVITNPAAGKWEVRGTGQAELCLSIRAPYGLPREVRVALGPGPAFPVYVFSLWGSFEHCLRGYVIGPHFEPVQGARVVLSDPAQGTRELTTDSRGRFLFVFPEGPLQWKKLEVLPP